MVAMSPSPWRACLVALEQLELLGGGARGHLEPLQQRVGAPDLAQRAVGLERGDRNADRDAGLAGRAHRRIGDVVAAAEAGARQPVVQRVRVGAGDLGHDLALGPAGQIGAGQGGGRVEELRPARRFVAHAYGDPPCMFQEPRPPVNAPLRRWARTTTRPLARSCSVRWRTVNSANSSSRPVVASVR